MRRPLPQIALFVLALAAGLVVDGLGERVALLRAGEAGFTRLVVAAAVAPPSLIEETRAGVRVRRLVAPGRLEPLDLLDVGDDPRQVFEASPPSAGDYAVILAQLQRHGHGQVALSAPLAWDELDPVASAALEAQLAAFHPALTAAALSRGISARPLPAALARAAVPLTSIRGETRLLPEVNRTTQPNILLGEQATLAGFSVLDSEDPPNFTGDTNQPGPPLLARWGDQAVLALPLLVVATRAGITPAQLSIELGGHIRLGPDGPVIPIDEFGRLAAAPAGVPAGRPALAAEALIEALVAEPDNAQPLAPVHPPVVVRDTRSTLAGNERALTEHFSTLVARMEACPRPGAPIEFHRPPRWVETCALVGFAALAASCLRLPRRRRAIALLLIAVLTLMVLLVLGREAQLLTRATPAATILVAAALPASRRTTSRAGNHC